MDQLSQQNPLKQFFRQFKSYIKLPSGTGFYPKNVVELTEDGEIGIMPMTGRDELTLKNPDALLNGEALIDLISSCVPGVKNPRSLITNDINALIAAIRYATYSDSLETEISCPACGHENVYKLDLQYALDNMSFLEPEYFVNVGEVTVFVNPYTFPDLLKALHTQFEQAKLSRSVGNTNITDEQRAKIFGAAFKEIAITKFDLMCSAISRVVNEARSINVSDKKHIKEFLQNIDKTSVDKISALIDEINKVGVKNTFTPMCEKCNHTWESEIDFNPVNFS